MWERWGFGLEGEPLTRLIPSYRSVLGASSQDPVIGWCHVNPVALAGGVYISRHSGGTGYEWGCPLWNQGVGWGVCEPRAKDPRDATFQCGQMVAGPSFTSKALLDFPGHRMAPPGGDMWYLVVPSGPLGYSSKGNNAALPSFSKLSSRRNKYLGVWWGGAGRGQHPTS